MNANGINGQLPVNNGWASLKYSKSHNGIDIGWLTKYSKNGKDPVLAWNDGIVIQCGKIKEKIGGKYYYPIIVVLQHEFESKTVFTRYWHLDSQCVKVGQKVKCGQKIGVRGKTGYAKGVHLHFEMKICPKGITYAKASNPWSNYNVNPAEYTFVCSGQHFTNLEYNLEKWVETVRKAPETAKRDEATNQVEVIADALRVRLQPSLKGDIWCTCDKGVFDVLEAKEADGYTWYRIATDRWIASKEGEWTRYLASTTANKDQQIKELQAQLNVANQKIEAVRKAIL